MEKAIEIYKFILKEVNGWSQKDINNLTIEDVMGDPILEGIKDILGRRGKP